LPVVVIAVTLAPILVAPPVAMFMLFAMMFALRDVVPVDVSDRAPSVFELPTVPLNVMFPDPAVIDKARAVEFRLLTVLENKIALLLVSVMESFNVTALLYVCAPVVVIAVAPVLKVVAPVIFKLLRALAMPANETPELPLSTKLNPPPASVLEKVIAPPVEVSVLAAPNVTASPNDCVPLVVILLLIVVLPPLFVVSAESAKLPPTMPPNVVVPELFNVNVRAVASN